MRATEQSDGSLYTSSEWFVARITAVCDRESDEPCSGYPCSWAKLVYCDNMQAFVDEEDGTVSGDCLAGDNVAYPIGRGKPKVGDITLMRFRGAARQGENEDNEGNVFEFIGGGVETKLAMTALQCSGGVLNATFSDGCRVPTP